MTKNLKALMATEKVELFTTLFDNPEITAMAAISEILKELPDEAARMRVMRWSFARFSEEFKRPLAEPMAAPAPAAAVTAARAVEAAGPAPQLSAVAAAIDATAEAEIGDGTETADFARQISELNDLFPRSRGYIANSVA